MKRSFIITSTLVLLLVVLPTIIFFSQKKQESRSRASASTTLALTPSTTATTPLQKNVGDPVSFDVMIDPGQNLPSTVKLQIQYDQTKLKPASQSSFMPETSSFPTTVEGPVVSNGSVFITLSIGSDPTKAIQKPTKVGTVNFTAIAPTDTNTTMVSFGNKSSVLSLASTDQSTENVLSTTVPGYISIASLPTPTISEAPTATASPSTTPAPTVASTKLSFNVFMHGIGNSGDNANPTNSSLSNKNPLHPDRQITVSVYNTSNQLVTSHVGTIEYSSASGSFKGIVDMGNVLSQRQYSVKIQTPTFLRRLVPGIQTITPLQTNIIPTVSLVTGDVNNDNVLNIADYNLIIGCYSDLLPPVSCTPQQKLMTDINDDGAVNQVDYNLFLREITVQNGD